MSELYPLARHAVPGAGHPADGESGITLAERRPGSIVEVSFWDLDREMPDAILPGGTPQAPRAVAAPGLVHFQSAPGRYVAIGQEPGLAAQLEAAIPIEEGTVVDLTHGRTGIRVAGTPAADLVQKGVSFDVDSFAPIAATTAGIHHMAVTILRLDDRTFDLFVMTSLAGSLWDWASDAAVEYGWQVAAPVT